MNKACKKLIEKAKPYNGEEIGMLYIINSGKLYRGFWGKNGYNKIIVIGSSRKPHNEPVEYYNLSENYDIDKVSIEDLVEHERCNIDIEHKYNCVRVWFNKTITRELLLSDITFKPKE